MILEIQIEDVAEVNVQRPPGDSVTHIVLTLEGYTLTIVLPAGDILDTLASKLMLYSLWDNDEPEENSIPF